MNCHICGQPSIGQCQGCWEFHCAHHSSVVCENCARAEPGESGVRHGYVKVIAKQLRENDLALKERADRERPNVRKLMKWTASGRDRLERVIPVAQTQTSGDTEVTLLSVEVYNGGLVLNYRIRSVEAKNAMRVALLRQRVPNRWPEVGVPHVRWEATDDQGKPYESIRGDSGGSADDYGGSTAFLPKPSKKAKRLTVSAPTVQWVGSGSDTRPEGPGPWRFEIPLR